MIYLAIMLLIWASVFLFMNVWWLHTELQDQEEEWHGAVWAGWLLERYAEIVETECEEEFLEDTFDLVFEIQKLRDNSCPLHGKEAVELGRRAFCEYASRKRSFKPLYSFVSAKFERERFPWE